jgi:hypothetical protein
MLIAVKKEKYNAVSELEDLSDDLQNLTVILDHFTRDLTQKERIA